MNWISRNNEWYIANTDIYINYQYFIYTVVKNSREQQSFTNLETAKRYAENLNR